MALAVAATWLHDRDSLFLPAFSDSLPAFLFSPECSLSESSVALGVNSRLLSTELLCFESYAVVPFVFNGAAEPYAAPAFFNQSHHVISADALQGTRHRQ